MLKDSTYQQKFAILKVWMPTIVENIKKDLKNDHLKKDTHFLKTHFPGKNIDKLNIVELSEGYSKAIANSEQGESIAEWIAQRWLLKKSDLYAYFERKLAAINPQFDNIEEIEDQKADEMIHEAIQVFGAPDTYLFTILNSVVFSPKQIEALAQKADREVAEKSQIKLEEEEKKSQDKLIANYEQRLARLMDKYEKKLQGFERKYLNDTESLKKQIAALQRQLNSNAH